MARNPKEVRDEIADKIGLKAPPGSTSESIFAERVKKAIDALIQNGYIDDIHRNK